MAEQTDFDGNDCFWYLDEFNLFEILACRIMDQVIQKKWKGKFDINVPITDYSTPYTLLVDKYKIFASDTVFSELNIKMFILDRKERTHQYKFEVWLRSMGLRFQIDAIIILAFTIFFQLFLNKYLTSQNIAKKSILKLREMEEDGTLQSDP